MSSSADDSFYKSTVGTIFVGRNQYYDPSANAATTQNFGISLNNVFKANPSYNVVLAQFVQSHSSNVANLNQTFVFGDHIDGRFEISCIKTGATTGTSSLTCNNFISYSDARIKKNIETISENQGVDNIRVVQYNSTSDDTKHFGVIAHELAEIYPELVNGEKDGTEMQSVTYIELIPLCINEIQKLKRENLSLLSRLETLERKMNDLTS